MFKGSSSSSSSSSKRETRDSDADEAFVGGIGNNNFDGGGATNGRVRYDSPTIAGFTLSASWAHGDDDDVDQDSWSVALRYAGEFGAFRVAGGIGYQERELAEMADRYADIRHQHEQRLAEQTELLRHSGKLSNEIIEALETREGGVEVVRRDLSKGIAHVDETWIQANFTPEEERTRDHRETSGPPSHARRPA